MDFLKRKTIRVGNLLIGNGRKPVIQSMTKTPTENVTQTVEQIIALQHAGCELVRVAIKDRTVLASFKQIVQQSPLPVIADVHFDSFLALEALKCGAAGIRINPGNFGDQKKLIELLRLAKEKEAVVRIGVNAGSLEKKYQLRRRQHLAESLVNSALDWVKFFEDQQFFNLKISVKSSDIAETVKAYRLLAAKTSYPLHIGLTEAGTGEAALIKSVITIGSLLLDGIGDTIRVSLTASPLEEVRLARRILVLLGFEKGDLEIISCPTCGRTSVDLIAIVNQFKRMIDAANISSNLKIALMGCEVNGPQEARDADAGIAFSRGKAFFFEKGELKEKNLSFDQALKKLVDYVQENSQRCQ